MMETKTAQYYAMNCIALKRTQTRKLKDFYRNQKDVEL